MLIKINGRLSNDYLSFGIQSNPDSIDERIHSTAKWHKPKNAKSYKIVGYKNTDYFGNDTFEHVTGYAQVKVSYFTTKKEGDFLIE